VINKFELRNITLFLSILICFGCVKKTIYLDSDYPKKTPKIYAKGIINIDGRLQQNLTISNKGKEHYFTVTDSELWRYESILRVKNHNKIQIDTPSFVKNFEFNNERFIGEPMIAPNNQELFFVADFPSKIWSTKRLKSGIWGKPKLLSTLSTLKSDWYPSISKSFNIYFTNGVLLKAKRIKDTYPSFEKVNFNGIHKDIRDVCISPNEDYLIYTAQDSSGFGKSDLYVSFKKPDGNWSTGKNLGNKINTKYREFAPYISPDEQFLFFSRRDQWQNAKFSNIYWVSLSKIKKVNKNMSCK